VFVSVQHFLFLFPVSLDRLIPLLLAFVMLGLVYSVLRYEIGGKECL